MGVTPGLVAGAWVGGEYRSIHFRTGALGQGSRTALPIVGYFMQSVFGDSQFSKYRRKFGEAKEPISSSCYSCNYVPRSKAKRDSVQEAKDSLEFDINLDEHVEEGHAAAGETGSAEQQAEKKKKKKDNGEVNFDDFVN